MSMTQWVRRPPEALFWLCGLPFFYKWKMWLVVYKIGRFTIQIHHPMVRSMNSSDGLVAPIYAGACSIDRGGALHSVH